VGDRIIGEVHITVTPQKYLPKPGFQGKTDPLQKIIPTLLLKQLILKFSVSIDFYKRNLFYIESFYSWYNHNQVEVVEQKKKNNNFLYESPIQKFKVFDFGKFNALPLNGIRRELFRNFIIVSWNFPK
jgi:hypothetical protein